MKTKNELLDLYGERYVEAFERDQSIVRLSKLVQFMTVAQSFDVIDFACGSGMLMPLVAPQAKSYVGIDFSSAFIAAANKKKEHLSILNARFECGDIVEFCCKNANSFDVGFAMDFSEHVYDDEWLYILANIKKCLKPQGRLYLHTPNGDFFVEKMKSYNFILRQLPEHIAVRNSFENIDILKKAGFRVELIKLIPHYNICKLFHPLSYFPLVGKYFKARIFIEAIVD